MNMLLEKKNNVIYAARGGVATAVARAFANEGARLFLAGRTPSKIETQGNAKQKFLLPSSFGY